MKITGTMLHNSLEDWKLRAEALRAEWNDSLMAYEGDDKRPLEAVSDELAAAEAAQASLQAVQVAYNLAVKVDIGGKTMSLSEAIKRVGGVGRMKNLWSALATTSRRNTYSYGAPAAKDPTMKYAKETYTPKQALKKQQEFQKLGNQLRAAITRGNMTEINLEVDAKLFE